MTRKLWLQNRQKHKMLAQQSGEAHGEYVPDTLRSVELRNNKKLKENERLGDGSECAFTENDGKDETM